MKIHCIQAGRLVGNKITLRESGWSSVLRRPERYEFPSYVYVIEHPDGHIVIDTGMNTKGWSVPLPLKRLFPSPLIEMEKEEIGPRMEYNGLNPEDVQLVILTHLDVDHIGGIRWFPNAEVLVHRPEYDFVNTILGKIRYQPELWSTEFEPTLYDMDPQPYGPFPQSKVLSENKEIRLVPLPGHTHGQIGVILQNKKFDLFFSGDQTLRQEWFIEDLEKGQPSGLLLATLPKKLVETTRRIESFLNNSPAVLLPAHDTDAPERLSKMEPIKLYSSENNL